MDERQAAAAAAAAPAVTKTDKQKEEVVVNETLPYTYMHTSAYVVDVCCCTYIRMIIVACLFYTLLRI